MSYFILFYNTIIILWVSTDHLDYTTHTYLLL